MEQKVGLLEPSLFRPTLKALMDQISAQAHGLMPEVLESILEGVV
jgi:hypothetical protein